MTVRPLGFLRSASAVDTFWALLENGSSLFASTLSFLLLGRSLAAAGYGAYLGLYALIGPFTAFSQSGVFLATLEHTVREREDPNDVMGSCLSLTLVNALLFVPIVTGIALSAIDGITALTAVLFVGAEFFLNGPLVTAAGMMQAVRGFSSAARLRMTSALSRTALLIALAGTGTLSLRSLAIGQATTLAAVMAFALLKVGRLPGLAVHPRAIRRAHVRSTLLYGLGIAASSAQSDGDKFVLNAAHFQAAAGQYGAAYRLVQIAMLPINALAGATHLSFLHVRGTSHNQVRRVVRLSLVGLAYGLPAVIGILVIAPWVPKILTRDFAETPRILQLLAPIVILRGLGTFPMNGLMGLGRNDLRTRLLIANALFSILLYIALIPTYSWKGALAATLVSESSLFLSAWAALLACVRHQKGPEIASGEGALGEGALNEP